MPHLVLIDGPNYVFRAFHAIRHLSNSKGEPTNAVFGYVQMLKSVLGRLAPTHVAVAFDTVIESFRNDLFDGYKTGEGIEDLRQSILYFVASSNSEGD